MKFETNVITISLVEIIYLLQLSINHKVDDITNLKIKLLFFTCDLYNYRGTEKINEECI